MSTDIQIIEQSPSVWQFPGQLPQKPLGNFGICDGSAVAKLRQSAEPWRYGHAYFIWNVVGGHFVLAASSKYTAFTKGEKETAPIIGMMTLVETDLNSDGTMVKNNQVYIIKSLGVQALKPFVLDNNTKTYPSFIEGPGGYAERLLTAMYDNVALRYEFRDDDCQGDLGLIKFWPQHASLQGAGQVYNADAMGPASVVPLRRQILTGGKASEETINVVFTSGKEVRVEQDPLQPIPAGLAAIVMPLQIIAYGSPECAVRCMPACVTADGRIQVVQTKGPTDGR
jgi:hypothetical protein